MPARLWRSAGLTLLAGACALGVAAEDVSTADIHLTSTAGRVQGFDTIQAAVDVAGPGDVIEVGAGTYHESVQFSRSGTSDQPITLKGKDGAHVVIDGAYRSLQEIDEPVWQSWEFEGKKMYKAVLPFTGEPSILAIGTWISRYGVPGSNGCDQLIASYASLAALKDAVRGPGSFRRGSEVFLCLDENENPNEIPLSIGSCVAVLDLGSQSGIHIQNLEIRNAGWAGIRLGDSGAQEVMGMEELDLADLNDGVDYSDVEISNVTIRNCFRGISTGRLKGEHVTIEGVVVANGVQDDIWPWGGAYTAGVGRAAGNNSDDLAPWRGFGIRLTNLSYSEVKDSVVSGQWDGMGLKKCHYVQVHNCTLRNLMDDAVELESLDQSEIQFNNNLLYNVFAGVSVTANTPGPIYVYRNVAEVTHPGGRSFVASYGVKSGLDNYGKADNVKIYQNTFYTHSYSVWEKYGDPAENRWNGYDFINNIFYVYGEGRGNYNFRGLSKEESGAENHWAGNVYNRDKPEDEQLSITDENLATYFMDTDVSGPGEARDLRLQPDLISWPSGSTYAIDEGWPDDSVSDSDYIERGAWRPDMDAGKIGAPESVLKRVNP